MAVNAKEINGDVIIYNSATCSLILVDKKYVGSLPKSSKQEAEFWKRAKELVREGKARIFEKEDLNTIADALRDVILLRPLLWMQPAKP